VDTLDLALLPAEAAHIDADCYVVVDVLRATTTIATLFARGLQDLVAVDSLRAALARGRDEARLTFGEEGGIRPAGFDHGNSPLEVSTLDLAGARAVLCTTNGTRALCSLPPEAEVVTGALANASAVAAHVAAFRRVVLVCCGTAGGQRFTLEDFGASAVLLRLMVQRAPDAALGDAAALALSTSYEDLIAPQLPQRTDKSRLQITTALHARHLVAIGLGADINFAIQEDTSAAVPRVARRGEGWALLEDAASA
jgi:2-phosphosulfolactate phosphatase